MDIQKLADMTRGWFIGNFSPAVLRTDNFEVGVLSHKKGEFWEPHYHKIGTEYNVLISGEMSIQNKLLKTGDIFTIKPYEVADPVYHTDCTVLVVKVPSIPGDKYKVDY